MAAPPKNNKHSHKTKEAYVPRETPGNFPASLTRGLMLVPGMVIINSAMRNWGLFKGGVK